MDGQMCEDVRLGIHLRQAFSGGLYRRKDGGGVPTSFSSWLLDEAGGVRRFLEEWEEDPQDKALREKYEQEKRR